MKLNTKKVSTGWFEYEDADAKASFCIRPYAYSEAKLSSDDLGEVLLQQFLYCLTDWKGLTDEDDNDFECNDENKLFIYDYVPKLRDFVLIKANELNAILNLELKN